MTDLDRPASLAEFGDKEHQRRDIPDGAFIYRSGDKTIVGHLEQFEVGGTRFRPKLTADFVADSDENFLYEFRDPQTEETP